MVANPQPLAVLRRDPSTGRRRTVTVEEAADLLGIGRTLAYRLIHEGTLPVLRLGRRTLIPTEALDRLLAAATEAPPSTSATDRC